MKTWQVMFLVLAAIVLGTLLYLASLEPGTVGHGSSADFVRIMTEKK